MNPIIHEFDVFCIFVCDRADLVIAGVVAVSRLDVLIVWET